MTTNNITCPITATDLAWFVQNESSWSQPTKSDYVRAVRRLPILMGRTRLEDVIIDLPDLKERFPLDGFDPSHFASQDAYKAWRRKTMAAASAFLGHARPISRNDAWAKLNRSIEMFTREHPDFHAKNVLKLASLTAVARRDKIDPQQLDSAYVSKICQVAPNVSYKEVRNGVELLNRLREAAPPLRQMLPAEPLEVPEKATKIKSEVLPEHLEQELEAWIQNFCAGDIDEITEDEIDGKSQSTVYTYRAAGRKYLATAVSLGLLHDVPNLAAALDTEIAKQVLRTLLTDRERANSVQLRTLRSYMANLLRLARSQGNDAKVIERALNSNRELRQGRKQAQQMSPKAKEFCIRLLANRAAEMTYRSLHLRFRGRFDTLVAMHNAGERVPYHEERLFQVAALAAMSAIWIWGAPLRVANMCQLKLYGNTPQIWLPHGKTKDVHIILASQETKNNRDIRQRLRPGRHRAIETIDWYVNEIRPKILKDADSIWMFPSMKAPDRALGTNSARNWLHRHSAEIGLPMKPHWFRHAAASLYIREHAGAYDHVAQLLDDTPQVVRKFYAWIDEMAVLDEVQANILEHAGFDDA